MMPSEQAKRYARALGELIWAATKRVQYPQSPSILQEQVAAERELAEAVEALTFPGEAMHSRAPAVLFVCCGSAYVTTEALHQHQQTSGHARP